MTEPSRTDFRSADCDCPTCTADEDHPCACVCHDPEAFEEFQRSPVGQRIAEIAKEAHDA